MASERSDEELRRLYLDWCSTQVARRFLELSLDEVWLRSHVAETLAGSEAQGLPESLLPPAGRMPGYLDLVRRTTLLLAREMDLPPFPSWKEAYLRDPRTFSSDIMGE